MRAFGCAVMVRVSMCLSRVLFEVVSTRGRYGMLVPMNSYMYSISLYAHDIVYSSYYMYRIFHIVQFYIYFILYNICYIPYDIYDIVYILLYMGDLSKYYKESISYKTIFLCK